MNWRWISVAVAFASWLFPNNVFAENIRVFAAASMTNVLQQLGMQYQTKFPADQLTFSFAGSSTLAKQIEQDAPADLFISADQHWADYLIAHQPNKITNQRILAKNSLVLIAPKESDLHAIEIQQMDLPKILGERYLAIADDNVPAGRYAKKALTYLGKWNSVETRLAKAKDVRAVLSYVARDELPLGIVYATDANISPNVKIVAEFPPISYGDIVYPILALNNKPEVQRFFAFLFSSEARQTFQDAGFVPVE
ncbi:molybdate ABC transporter substrate-binding protein [Vespertiliibacter pulmonis]|uniref:Molybdate transport system substrate-binding protein n=1 Tax=Vespertiliibacter pulmonis TaxID=1443036 RepID=A0A3N4VY16_9PAST|nr:molybdate ABC transporter substrate-binding protein [Vespertiliibacter pulmonis]QLB20254.1 molybdate ABC transporter substrate-binding protein [Vespertiliibacter pulmonis]RPE86233.1 molybdate transport system substrate-binding protein [Vespertiliibacter pulmonis]